MSTWSLTGGGLAEHITQYIRVRVDLRSSSATLAVPFDAMPTHQGVRWHGLKLHKTPKLHRVPT